MEVHAQNPSTSVFFAPNCDPKSSRFALAGAVHINDASDTAAVPLADSGAALRHKLMFFNGGAVLSGDLESELTCNASGSRKRTLDYDAAAMILQQQQKRLHRVPPDVPPPLKAVTAGASCGGTTASMQMTYNKVRLSDSGMTSTSGRPPAEALMPSPSAVVDSPLMEKLVLQLYCQSLEVDAFIQLQNERIRLGLEETWKRHHRALLSTMERGIVDRLREKEAELEAAARRNAELEERIRQLVSENQIWFNVARSKETIASSLRATLEQVLLQQNPTAPEVSTSAVHLRGVEGFGENDCAAQPVHPANDAESCCYGGDDNRDAAAGEVPSGLRRQGACKVCGKREVSTLLLPCRHLCVCERCDGAIGVCPVCGGAKSASLRVSMC